MMGERRGHPTAGWVIFAATIALAGALVALAIAGFVVGVFGLYMECQGAGPGCSPDLKSLPRLLLAAVPVVLVLGLWSAWRVGTGGWGRRRGWWPTHQIPEGGVEAWVEWKGWQRGAGERAVLAEGLPVRLREYRGIWARVVAEDGRGGWVEAGLPIPLDDAGLPASEAGNGEG